MSTIPNTKSFPPLLFMRLLTGNLKDSSPYIIPTGLFLLALGIRMIYLQEFQNNPLFDIFPHSLDHFNFDEAAQNFANGDILARATNNGFAPLYKYFLGLLYWLAGRDLYVVYCVQFCMGALSSVLVFYIGKYYFGTFAGILAGLGLAFYTTHIIYEGIILRATFISFWGVLSCYLLLRLKENPKKINLILATLALSLFFQARPNTFLCLPLICFFLNRKVFVSYTTQQKLCCWKTFAGLLLVSFIPLLIQCYLVHDKFVFFDASGPHPFISGNVVDYSGVGFEHEIVEGYRKENQLNYDAAFLFLIDHIIKKPWEFFLLYTRKTFFFLNDFEPPTNISIYLFREFSNLLPFLLNHFALVSSLALLGMVVAWKRGKDIFLLSSYTISLSVAIILFHNSARYRIPIVPFIFIFAGHGLNSILSSFLTKNLKQLVVYILGFSALFFALQEPKGMVRIRSNDYGNVGNAYIALDQWGEAVESFERSLNISPGNVYAHINLGRILAQHNRRAEAVTHFEIAVVLNPSLWEPYLNLGIIHSNAGRWEKAEKYFLKVKALFPESGDAFFHLGDLYGRMGKPKKAIEQLSFALNLNPKRIETLYLLGIEYERLGNRGQAISFLEKVVQKSPNDSKAWNNLGVLYSRINRWEEARLAFQKALKVDPKFKKARKNLHSITGST